MRPENQTDQVAKSLDAYAASLIDMLENLADMTQIDLQIPLQQLAKKARRLREVQKCGPQNFLVCLAGGTGGGKSSIFNNLTQSKFAEVSQIRPTTKNPRAAIFASNAEDVLSSGQLLDLAAIPASDRLTLKTGGPLSSVTLVDLPDYDSVALENSHFMWEIADLAQLLIWVVDPQKYGDLLADLRSLDFYSGQIVVVINKTDLVPPKLREQLVLDVRAKIAQLQKERSKKAEKNAKVESAKKNESVEAKERSKNSQNSWQVVQIPVITSQAITGQGSQDIVQMILHLHQIYRAEQAFWQQNLANWQMLAAEIRQFLGANVPAPHWLNLSKQVALVLGPDPALDLGRAVRSNLCGLICTGLDDRWAWSLDGLMPQADVVRRRIQKVVREKQLDYPQMLFSRDHYLRQLLASGLLTEESGTSASEGLEVQADDASSRLAWQWVQKYSCADTFKASQAQFSELLKVQAGNGYGQKHLVAPLPTSWWQRIKNAFSGQDVNSRQQEVNPLEQGENLPVWWQALSAVITENWITPAANLLALRQEIDDLCQEISAPK